MDKKVVFAGLLPALLLYSCDRAEVLPAPGAVTQAANAKLSGP
jgi:hypothetical protein